MKRTITFLFLCLFTLGIVSVSSAQTALDPNQFVNAQITGPGVYTVEAGQSYAFDGRIDLTYEITIQGPDNGWIKNDATPPVLINSPASDGAARDFFELREGGGITLKNLLLSGFQSGEYVNTFVNNAAGSKMIIDNCAISDWQNFAFRNQNKGDTLSITNSVFINGVRLRYSQWGGFPVRMDVACDNVTFENNTVVNSGRLLANSGPFNNATVHQLHNTYVNQGVAGEEQRANEFLTANNIFYNFHFLGYKTENHSSPDNTYGSYFTTWNYFADSKDNLDSVSVYLGNNLFYREPAILDLFNEIGGDSIAPSLLWEHPDVDSFILSDPNYTIGANFAAIDPMFTTHPGNTQAVVDHIRDYRVGPQDQWVDWRITSPVSSYDMNGLPVLNWPPTFDLSYSNSALQTAGTDGLPLGDLNWFPDKKVEYLAGKDGFLAALRDSTVNAKLVYDPMTMDQTPLITALVSSTEIVDPSKLYLSGNYPNPFRQNTAIKFGLDQRATVTLTVFNLFGQQVFEANRQEFTEGNHEINFNATNLSSGTYLYKISAQGRDGQVYVGINKMIIVNQ